MLKYLIVICVTFAFLGCSTSQIDSKKNHLAINTEDSTAIKLSHVKAYLLIGMVKQAQQTFDTIENMDNRQAEPNVLLTLAELRAASGNAEGAQQAFLLALANNKLDKQSVPKTLVDYFCNQKKWPALQGYGSALAATSSSDINFIDVALKNSTLTEIGLCFFDEENFDEAHTWLAQLDTTQQWSPRAYLAKARIAIEQQKNSAAQEFINQYEVAKTSIDAKMLWTAFEVYRALKQPGVALQLGENLRSLFPSNKYTRKYILVVKRGERARRKQQKHVGPLLVNNLKPDSKQTVSYPDKAFHIIEKGETLYQLSKRYGITISDLLKFNPDLVVDDISLGTSIRIQ